MRNFPAFRFASRVSLVLTALPVVAHAHPGHDGHELTWDFGHLAAHPLVTLGWFALLSASLWSAAKLFRSSAPLAKAAIKHRDAR
jgi:hypothetical protein